MKPCFVASAVSVLLLASWTRGDEPKSAAGGLVVMGRTQCILHRKAIIAPAVLHPVEEVLVAVGDRVKKGQPLVKIDADEPQAELRCKQAALESARLAAAEAKRVLTKIDASFHQGAIPEQRFHDAKVAALKAELDERHAKATLEAATAELEHYTVTAPIDGVINRLEVHPGMVSRPGTTVWGEILDLSEIDIACQLTPEQADQLTVGEGAEVRNSDGNRLVGKGRVVFIGLAADEKTGKFPALVRAPNQQGGLRCGVAVQVRFVESKAARSK